ncbi:hypothetical protein [Anaeromusa acidaminophila]|uniref:hypothetical protein n=1 Tax=Anaeromusa acidaminophila TaxID=81464 RepID=UPI000360D4EA|nr:hypothetical protein [Anaeromusa acidaminophila]
MSNNQIYLVQRAIPEGLEVPAQPGEILTVDLYQGVPSLFLRGKAVCDLNSVYAKEYCEIIPVAKEAK